MAETTILEKIVASTRVSVAARKKKRPLAEFRESVRPSTREFARSLRHGSTGYILECKRKSPSQGEICASYDPVAVARAYADVATALSVLTDEPYFGGSHAHLRAIRGAVDLPLLCKDFFVDEYQIWEARDAGADAILLLANTLDDAQLKAFLALAREVGIDCLVEVHDEREMERAVSAQAELIGINNRDLRTFAVDLAVTERLARLAPRNVPIICESGISSHQDVVRLRAVARGFLVGTHLMRQPSIAVAARELVFGRVKVCGLTRAEDAQAAWKAGAVFGGMIFAAESPRRIDIAAAQQLRQSAPLHWVGVFVNEKLPAIADAARQLRLSAVQLHGDETAHDIQTLRPLLPNGCAIWKAVGISDRIPLATEFGADRILADTSSTSGQRGGTGHVFDWELVRGYPDKDRLIVAGGLNPENIRSAESLGVWALDVNSGVESGPGIKSHEKLNRLFVTLRG